MDVVKEVKKLNLPIGQYVVIGSAVMAVHGLREAKDIDMVVSEDLFNRLEHDGWKRVGGFHIGKALHFENFEAFSDCKYKGYQPENDFLFSSAEIINDIPFMPFAELIKFKKVLGREKDFRDIKAIEEYLKKIGNPSTI